MPNEKQRYDARGIDPSAEGMVSLYFPDIGSMDSVLFDGGYIDPDDFAASLTSLLGSGNYQLTELDANYFEIEYIGANANTNFPLWEGNDADVTPNLTPNMLDPSRFSTVQEGGPDGPGNILLQQQRSLSGGLSLLRGGLC